MPAMPELPEVEQVRRTLRSAVVGRRVVRASVRRADVVHGAGPGDLLDGRTVADVQRRGKQLALVGDDGRCVCIHLGMSGQLRHVTNGAAEPRHTHVIWTLGGGGRVWFTDPRRFGGVWAFEHTNALHRERWDVLGPDAMRITPAVLWRSLQRTRRALKAALLDQGVVAGLGNIYVDELLFRARLHPLTAACAVERDAVGRLVPMMRRLLARAIAAGGSTLRDYVDATGEAGGFQRQHRVYGRSGQPCRRCGEPLESHVAAGRTTVCCPACQPLKLSG